MRLFAPCLACFLALPGILSAESLSPPAIPAGETELVQEMDRLFAERWKAAQVSPTKTANDAEFLRRVYLDVTGSIPTAQAAEEFIQSRSALKREKLIEDLVRVPEAAKSWADRWLVTLLGRQMGQARVDRWALEQWLEKTYREEVPYDQFIREFLTAEGRNDEVGPVNFFLRFEGPEEPASAVSRIFLGLQIQCAQCHNHPYEKWTQQDFRGFTAFFSRLNGRREDASDEEEMKAKKEEKMEGPGRNLKEAKVRQPKDNKLKPRFVVFEAQGRGRPRKMAEYSNVQPRFLDGVSPSVGPRAKLRPLLADWMTDPKNPFVARAAVNRLWGQLLGRGLVHPVDDFGTNNPPSHPEVLDLLARDFLEHQFDVRRLLRVILKTQVYQLSSRVPSNHRDEPPPDELFAWQRLKPMTAEQILESLVQATGLRNVRQAKNAAKAGDQARQVFRQYNFVFSTDEMEEVSAFEGTIQQALLMMNGLLVNEGVRPLPGNTMSAILASKESLDKKIDGLFLGTVTRLPEITERVAFQRYLREQKESKEAWSDLQWALLNSSEFLFVH